MHFINRTQGVAETVRQVAPAHAKGDAGNVGGYDHFEACLTIITGFIGPGKPLKDHLDRPQGQGIGIIVTGWSDGGIHGMGQNIKARTGR